MNEIYDLFKEFDTDTICVTDFNIIVRGVRVDNIIITKNGVVQIWGGNPHTDKCAEELVLTPSERKLVFEEILEYF
jgi:hypothetical protein